MAENHFGGYRKNGSRKTSSEVYHFNLDGGWKEAGCGGDDSENSLDFSYFLEVLLTHWV